MATIVKRNGSWRAMVRRKGHHHYATFDTKAEAERWAYSVESSLLSAEVLTSSPARVRDVASVPSMVELFKRYKQTVSSYK
ncbi:hypothetical protein COMNV_01328 [Commensalibacter sp. Nvir]|uniref:hypothetical protein n=1 Tax=Commensalibacter sp. Nvir TaxID=3069817 RepID=UPI002D2784BC|nr:hypothetical protein COMNV_01328 [Commensalibacter sp. Nvir]